MNNAIETLHSSVPTEKWTYVNVMVAPSSITISDHEVLIVISIVCAALCRICCKLSTVIDIDTVLRICVKAGLHWLLISYFFEISVLVGYW